MEAVGRNPARILPLWHEFLDANVAAGRGAAGIGEPVWFGRSPAEVTECQFHESLLNLAFAEGPGWKLLCPYDASLLAEPVLEAARRSHPYLVRQRQAAPATSATHNEEFEHVANVLPLSTALSEPRDEVHQLEFGPSDLGAVRGLRPRDRRQRCARARPRQRPRPRRQRDGGELDQPRRRRRRAARLARARRRSSARSATGA